MAGTAYGGLGCPGTAVERPAVERHGACRPTRGSATRGADRSARGIVVRRLAWPPGDVDRLQQGALGVTSRARAAWARRGRRWRRGGRTLQRSSPARVPRRVSPAVASRRGSRVGVGVGAQRDEADADGPEPAGVRGDVGVRGRRRSASRSADARPRAGSAALRRERSREPAHRSRPTTRNVDRRCRWPRQDQHATAAERSGRLRRRRRPGQGGSGRLQSWSRRSARPARWRRDDRAPRSGPGPRPAGEAPTRRRRTAAGGGPRRRPAPRRAGQRPTAAGRVPAQA